tara:strand:- start:4547 stop:5068 length:522 start_codon:yes stop_codon:yes gene_type:complete
MFNKKALGIHWIFLILAAGVSIVLCLGSSRIGASVPDVGNFPIQLSMELEKNSNTFLIIDSIMKQIAKQTIDKLSELESTEALDLTSEFEDIFEEKYSQFKEKKFEEFNLDFSDVIYEFSVENENGKFFIKGVTDNNLEIPMKLTEKYGRDEKQIGRVWINPSFKVPIGYDFT